MDFPDDTRAVSQVIGALLIFAFLIIAFSSYQATVVPDQNAEIEFSHSQEVQADFVGLRNAVLNAEAAETQSQQIPLSVQYPSRAIAVNAGPGSGSLRTTELGSYTLTTPGGTTTAEVCRLPSGPVTTQRLSFTPNYNYYDGAPERFSYENSIAYRSFDSADRVDTSQTLVQGSTVRIRPVSGEIQRSEERAVSVTATAGTTATQQVAAPGSGATVELRVPSALPAAEWLAQTEIESSPIVTDVRDDGDAIVLELAEAGSGITIACTPVGLDAAPPEQATPTPGGGGGGGSGSASNVNVVSSGTTGGDSSTVTFELKNTLDRSVTITKISVDSTTQGSVKKVDRPSGAELEQVGGPGVLDATLDVGDPKQSLDTNAKIGRDSAAEFELGQFRSGGGGSTKDMSGETVTITLEFDDGTAKQYTLEL